MLNTIYVVSQLGHLAPAHCTLQALSRAVLGMKKGGRVSGVACDSHCIREWERERER